jgi:hypothetical protein
LAGALVGTTGALVAADMLGRIGERLREKRRAVMGVVKSRLGARLRSIHWRERRRGAGRGCKRKERVCERCEVRGGR